MMTSEETRVLEYLRRHGSVAVSEVARACLSGASPEWVDRVVANLDWLGYVAVHHGPEGEPVALQITEKGLEQDAGGGPRGSPRG
jgi:DNA-binding MarR family transcriptional regulator